MLRGVEIDFVVPDSIKALELYERIFEVERVEVTNYETGSNEVLFNIYGVRFHMLDENPDYQLVSPTDDSSSKSMWLNILVPDINDTFDKAITAGCKEVQPVTEMKAFGISNAMFTDPFGYLWMLHQRHREVGFEERSRILEEMMDV